jgi:3-deoxy-D-manno-octulosonic-acid transferase
LRSEVGVYSADEISSSKNLSEIYCVDTFGEVGTFLRLADVCFVGGSLVPIGGHNIYEPVALRKPVLHGPFMDNALEVRDFLRANGLAFEVKNADDIYKICDELLSNEESLKSVSEKALSVTKNESLQKINKIMQLERFFSKTA